MRRWGVVLAAGAIVLAIVGWLIWRSLDEPVTIAAGDAALAPTALTAPTVGRTPETETLVTIDGDVTVRDKGTGTLRVTIDAPGRIRGETDPLELAFGTQGEPWRSVPVPETNLVEENVAQGKYTLRVVSTAVEGDAQTAVVRAGELTDVVMRIPLPTMGRLRMTTVDAERKPLPRVAITVIGSGVWRPMATGLDGVAMLFVPAGEYQVTSGDTTVRAQVINGITRDVQIVVRPTTSVRGLVVDGAGRPVTDGLAALHMGDRRTGTRPVEANGAFELPVTGPPPYFVVAWRTSGGKSPIVSAVPGTETQLVIDGGAKLTGTVTDGRAKVPAFAISIEEVRGLDLGRGEYTNGAFAWPNLGPGDYRVSAVVGARSITKHVVIAPDAKAASVELVLSNGFTLTGRIVDAVSGDPIANAKVILDRLYTDVESVVYTDSIRPSITDAKGAFTFVGVPASEYELSIVAGIGYLGASSRSINVSTDLDLHDIAMARAR